MLEFAWPYAFAALPLPLLARWLPPVPATGGALRVPFFAVLAGGDRTGWRPRAGWRWLAGLLIWLLLLVAAGRPQWVGDPLPQLSSGRDLLLAVDISGSMETEDMLLGERPASRLRVVKAIIGEFIERRIGDRIGLILFGAQAYLHVPLTFDRRTVRTLLNEAEIGFAGRETALGEAVALAAKRLREPAGDHRRVVVLLTDGANTAGVLEPLRAAELAAQLGLRIYAIGVGTEAYSMAGRGRRQPAIDLDERTLTALANRTGGHYFRARDSRTLQDIYRLLDELEPVAGTTRQWRPRRELYPWPLAAALVLSAGLALAASGWHPWRRDDVG
jgi:Ca-activated chloride channel family protein